MDVRVGPSRRLSTEEIMLSNCGAGEDSGESLGLQGDPMSQFSRKSTLSIHWQTLESPLDCKEVPGLPGAPQDEAGLRRKFETSHV